MTTSGVAPLSASRVLWMDAARGLGIILVVLGHVERGLVSAHIASAPWWLVLDYTLYTFHMPLFFLLAGLNAPHGLERGRGDFLRSKLWTIAYPYFLWSLVQGVVLALAASVTNGKAGFSDLLTIGWEPQSQFWFLWVLMACQITIAILGVNTRLLLAVAVAAFLGSQFTGGLAERYLHALPFFLAGAAVVGPTRSWRQLPNSVWPLVLWAAFAACVFIGWRVSPGKFDALIALPSAVTGIAATIATARSISGRLLQLFCYLGHVSMSIYVMHILFAAGLRIVMVKLHIPAPDWAFALACTALGIVAPAVAHQVLNRFGLLPALGLGKPVRRGQ